MNDGNFVKHKIATIEPADNRPHWDTCMVNFGVPVCTCRDELQCFNGRYGPKGKQGGIDADTQASK